MDIELVKSDTRGTAEHGWLHSKFSFSFAEYYNMDKMGFGLLRVLNDDIIEPAKGFGFHPHNNMEIISIPIYGAIQHKDSMGNTSVIEAGEVQIMSAGSGIVHSEYNPSESDSGNFLQIWILPKKRNIEPRYQQLKFNFDEHIDELLTVVSPKKSDNTLWINQDAYLSLGKFADDKTIGYNIKEQGNAIFLFVIEGKVKAGEFEAGKRDALQITNTPEFTFSVEKGSHILIIDVPVE